MKSISKYIDTMIDNVQHENDSYLDFMVVQELAYAYRLGTLKSQNQHLSNLGEEIINFRRA
jgi:hypothetical protein